MSEDLIAEDGEDNRSKPPPTSSTRTVVGEVPEDAACSGSGAAEAGLHVAIVAIVTPDLLMKDRLDDDAERALQASATDSRVTAATRASAPLSRLLFILPW